MELTSTDIAYQNAEFIANSEEIAASWLVDAEAFRKNTKCDLEIAYGEHERAKLDLFWPKGTPQGLMIFVHGGYWKARNKSDWSHFAAGSISNGYAVAMIGYPLAPNVRIREITSFIRFGIVCAAARVDGPIRLAGHSAGGHLVARMAMPGNLPEKIASRIASVVPISPVSDLRPLLGTVLNQDLQLTEKEAKDESPMLGKPLDDLLVSVVVGAEERPVFLDQARWLAEAWDCTHIISAGRNHFDVIDDLKDPQSRLMRALFA